MPRSDSPSIGAIRIGRHDVGPRCRTLVIAEVGVNHDGDPARAWQLLEESVRAGADAVKFQMFRADELVAESAPAAAYQRSNARAESQKAMLRSLELRDDCFLALRRRCDELGAMFLATPFSVADVARLAALTPPAIKLASTDLNNAPLVVAAVACGLPLIVSVGASTASEIDRAVDRLRQLGALDRTVLLHCVSAYPTPIEQINLRAIASLAECHRVPVGLSDHTTSVDVGGWALAAGACVVEKHVTWNRTASGPDHATSLEIAQFAEYVRLVRGAESALGSGEVGHQSIEEDVRAVAGRSVVSARPLRQGQPIDRSELTVKRPRGGIPPDEIDGLIGRRPRRDIPADAVLTWDLFQ